MRGADASAGTIKSGGATRRAAKMVILDKEEEKIRALRDAGFDMDLGGDDITSVQYQNEAITPRCRAAMDISILRMGGVMASITRRCRSASPELSARIPGGRPSSRLWERSWAVIGERRHRY